MRWHRLHAILERGQGASKAAILASLGVGEGDVAIEAFRRALEEASRVAYSRTAGRNADVEMFHGTVVEASAGSLAYRFSYDRIGPISRDLAKARLQMRGFVPEGLETLEFFRVQHLYGHFFRWIGSENERPWEGAWEGPYATKKEMLEAMLIDRALGYWRAWKKAVRAFEASGWPDVLSVADLRFGSLWQELRAL